MIRHLFKKDVRHTRILLLVWLLLVALQCLLAGSSVNPGDRALQGIYFSISVIVPLLQALALVVIVPILVQEEPLVGTTAFWLTRPISRPALLGAKALFAAALIALPLLAEIGVLAANGVTRHDIGLAVPEIVLAQLSSIAVLGVIAVLTPNFGRYAIAGAVALAAWMLASWGFFWLRLLRNPESFSAAADFVTLAKSRGVVDSLLFALGGGAIVAHQYLTRKTTRSLAAAAVIGVAAVAVFGFWPWNFLAVPPLRDSGVKIDPASLTLSLGRSTARDLATFQTIGAPKESFAAEVDTAGLPPGFVATPRSVHPRLNLPNGAPIAVRDPAPSGLNLPPYVEAIEYALGGTPVANRVPFQHFANLLEMDRSVYNQCANQALTLTADIDFVASKYVVVSEMPLVPGARYDHGSEHAVITDVLRQGDSVEIVMRQHAVRLLFDPSGSASGSAANPVGFRSGDNVFLLRNKKLNEAILEKQSIGIDLSELTAAAGRRLIQRTLDFSFGPEQGRLTPELTEAWLAGAELVRLQLVPVAEYSKRFVVGKLRLNRSENFNNHPFLHDQPLAASLAGTTLPQNPTKAQVGEYIDAILAMSQRRASYRKTDPQVGMLVKIGPQNIGLLLDADNSLHPNLQRYIFWAIDDLARPEDKKLILEALPEHAGLITVVTKYDWTADAHDTLLAVLKDESRNGLPVAWIQAVAAFEEPSSYPALQAYLERCLNPDQTFRAIRHLPGIDLAGAVDAAWKRAKHGTPNEVLSACTMAAEFGHADAVAAAVDILRQGAGSDAQQVRAADFIRRFTPASGDSDALIAWFDANRDRLVFDARTEMFLLPPPPKSH